MKTENYLLILMLILASLVSACGAPLFPGPTPIASQTPIPTTTPTRTVSATQTSTLTSTQTPTKTSTFTPTATEVVSDFFAVSPFTSIEAYAKEDLPIEYRCPDTELPLSDLGLSPTSYLMTYSLVNETEEEWSLLDRDLTSILILNHTIVPGHYFHFGSISPDFHTYFFQESKKTGGEFHTNFWFGSTNDNQLRRKLENLDRDTRLLWASNTRLALINFVSPGDQYPAVVGRFDLDTLELVEFLPSESAYLYFHQVSFNPDGSEFFYLSTLPPDNLRIFDIQTKKAYTFVKTSKDYPWDSSANWSDRWLSIAAMDHQQLEILHAENSGEPREYNYKIQKFRFKDETFDHNIQWWSSDNSLLTLIRRVTVDSDPNNLSEVLFFYVLDLDRPAQYDYCIPINSKSFNESPDGKFVAWNVYDETDISGFYVMELATGKRAWIPDIAVEGWVEMMPELDPLNATNTPLRKLPQ